MSIPNKQSNVIVDEVIRLGGCYIQAAGVSLSLH